LDLDVHLFLLLELLLFGLHSDGFLNLDRRPSSVVVEFGKQPARVLLGENGGAESFYLHYCLFPPVNALNFCCHEFLLPLQQYLLSFDQRVFPCLLGAHCTLHDCQLLLLELVRALLAAHSAESLHQLCGPLHLVHSVEFESAPDQRCAERNECVFCLVWFGLV